MSLFENKIIVSWQTQHPLVKRLGSDFELVKVYVKEFANHETKPVINQPELIKDRQVIVPVIFHPDPNQNLITAVLVLNALKQAGADKVFLLAPWLAYSPQNRIFLKGEPLSLKVVISILESAGADVFIIGDLHHFSSLTFFNKPVIHLSLIDRAADYISSVFTVKDPNWLVVSPDQGGLSRAYLLSDRLSLPVAYFNKERDKRTGRMTMGRLVGYQSNYQKAVLIDDFSASGGTLLAAAGALRQAGIRQVWVVLSHLLIAPDRWSQLAKDDRIDGWIIGDAGFVPVSDDNLTVISWADVIEY